MARPTKAFNDRRDIQLHVRVNPDERACLEQTADALGLTVSEFLRRRGLGYRLPLAVRQAEPDRMAVLALVAVGNNLNQLTRHANAGRGLPALPLLEDTLSRINAILEVLHGPRGQQSGPVL